MISRQDIKKVTDIYYEVDTFLGNHKENFFTKEEIYASLPTDENGVCLYTIGSLNSALSNMTKMRKVEMEYVRGTRYYGFMMERKEW